MIQYARGSFEVQLTPQTLAHSTADPRLSRLSIDKQFHGDLQALSSGEMLSAFGNRDGSAGYVAIEHVRGTLHGRHGSFVLQHSSSMSQGTQQQNISVVPDSGTDELVGISGQMRIIVADGAHSYEFSYTLGDAMAGMASNE